MMAQGAHPDAQRWTPPPYTPPQQAPPQSIAQAPAYAEPESPPRGRSAAVTLVMVFIVLVTLASLGILGYVLVLPRLHH